MELSAQLHVPAAFPAVHCEKKEKKRKEKKRKEKRKEKKTPCPC
jgi:hypothetical protein